MAANRPEAGAACDRLAQGTPWSRGTRSGSHVSRIGKPADAMMFMDTLTHYVYSPVDPAYRFTLDLNRDGVVDTMPQCPDTAFNFGRPTVHNNGANVTLLDGHVERVGFKLLWQVDAAKKVVNSFWYLED